MHCLHGLGNALPSLEDLCGAGNLVIQALLRLVKSPVKGRGGEETKTENMNNIIKFTEFVESRVHENENLPEWDFLDQACLEEGLDEGLNEGKNDSSDLMGKIKSFISSITGKISKGMGQESVDPKVNGLLISVSKGIADSMKKAGNNPAEFRKELAASQQMKTKC